MVVFVPRCLKWIQASGNQTLQKRHIDSVYKTCRFCDLHFAASDINAKGLLKPNVVPTLHLPGEEEEDENAKSTQTKITFSCFCLDEIIALKGYCNAYDKKDTIQPKIEANCSKCVAKTVTRVKLKAVTRMSVKTQTGIALVCAETQTSQEDLIPKAPKGRVYKRKTYPQGPTNPQDLKFLEEQVRLVCAEEPNLQNQIYKILKLQQYFRLNYRFNKYGKEYKNIARNIYLASPLAYRVLATKFPLPSILTLRQENLNLGMIISELVIKKLKAKLKGNLGEARKSCIICADEMVLQRRLINKETVNGIEKVKEVKTKEPQTAVLVLIVRGLHNKWSQPLAFCLAPQVRPTNELLKWVDDIIIKVMELGYDVVGFTSSQTPTCIRIANERKISSIQPFFYIKDRKIHYFFDILSVMKNMRNVFMDNNFVYIDCKDIQRTASWADIENLYAIEKERPYQIAYRLTMSHIKPNMADKQKLKFAVQLFSKSVSVAMLSLIASNIMPESAIGTAKFIELMNDLFDILNSLPFCETNIYKQAFVSKDYQVELLNNVVYFLDTVIITYRVSGKEVTDSILYAKHLLVTVKSVLNLSLELQIKDAASRLYTRRLNLEATLKFFAAIRRGAANSQEPTPHQFIFGFKKISENPHQLY